MKRLFLILLISSQLLALASCTIDNVVSHDTGNDSTDTEAITNALTDAITDTSPTADRNHTSIAQSPNGEYTIVTSKSGDVYYVYDDHAKLVKIAPHRRYLILNPVNGKEVTDISNSAFDEIPDKANFRIFGDNSSNGRKLAQRIGCIFIEWFDGYYMPDHYYPYNGDRSVWVENTDTFRADLIADNSQAIDTCLSHYKTDSTTEELLTEAVLFKLSSAAEFSRFFNKGMPEYYVREYTSSVVDDYDKYSIYIKGNTDEKFVMIRFGEAGTYEELVNYLGTIYTDDVIKTYFSDKIYNVQGFAFQKTGGETSSDEYGDGEYSLTFSDGSITMSSTHNGKYTDVTKSVKHTLKRDGITWKFDEYVPYEGYELADYERLKTKNKDLNNTFDYEVVTKKNGDIYHVYDDHAELIYVEGILINSAHYPEKQWERSDVILTNVNGVPVTKIADSALDDVRTPSDFRIYAEENEHFRSFAMDAGCIFIELFDGSFPNHYYPYNGDESVWGDNTNEYDLREMSFEIVSRSEELDSAVENYLSTGEGYDEVYELVLYYFAAQEHFFYSEWDTLPYVFKRKYQSANVDDNDKYQIYDIDDDGDLYRYVAVKYGEYDTYEELKELMKILCTDAYVEEYFAEESFGLKRNLSVDGYRFTYEMGIGSPSEYKNPILTLFIERNCILMRTQYEIWDYDYDTYEWFFTGKYSSLSNFFLVKDNGKWCWEEAFVDKGEALGFYKQYVSRDS